MFDKYGRDIQYTEYDWQIKSYEGGKVNFPYLAAKTAILFDYKTGDSRQLETTYQYDDYGNVIQTHYEGFLDDPNDQRTTTLTYYEDVSKWIVGKPSSSITTGNPEIKTEYVYYPENGSLKQEKRWLDTKGDWIVTEYTYDSYGNLKTTKDALGRITTTSYTYDGETNPSYIFPTSVENALGHTQHFRYDHALGKIAESTDPNGVKTTSTYDGFGRLKRVEDSEGISYVEYYYYDEIDKNIRPTWVKTITKIGGGLTDSISYNYYDGLGRTIETVVVVGNGQQLASNIVEYDSKGQVIKKYLPFYEAEGTTPAWGMPPTASSPATQYVYDPLGRVTQTIRPDGKVRQNLYTITTTETINEKAQHNKVTKDAYGRISIVEEANGKQMTYEYDTLGNLTTVTDCQGHATTMTYDSLGRKTSMTESNMGTWNYVYDDVGNLKEQTDNKQQTITFDYDNINRLISKSTGVTYIYSDNLKGGDSPAANGIGRLDRVTYPGGEASFSYDALGREVSSSKIIDGVTYTVSRDYDSLDRLKKVVYPDGQIVKYKYNKQGGIDLVGDDTDEDYFVTETRYDEYGHLEYVRYANGSETTYTYDDFTLRLNHITTKDKNGNIIQDLDYQFDNIGNITQIADSEHDNNTQYFQYDELNRLTLASSTGYITTPYEYDDIGNLKRKGEMVLNYDQTGNAGIHAVTSTTGSKSYTFEYDQNGNMTKKGDATYEWDIENRLKKVSISNSSETKDVEFNLQAGWNHISLPFKMIDQDDTLTPIENIPIGVLLLDINGKYDQVSRYDESIDDPSTGHWQHYVGYPDFDQFSYFQYGEGYLIYMLEPATITISGTVPSTSQAKELDAGWNLVCAPTTSTISVQESLDGVNYTSVQTWNGIDYEQAITFESGKSYWVQTPTTQTWTIQVEGQDTLYEYDGDGARTKRITENKTTSYVGSIYEIEQVGDDIKTTKQIYLGNNRLCSVELIYENGATEPSDYNIYYNHSDHLGSSNLITDHTGGLEVQNYQYKPFGELVSYTETGYNTDKRFAGKTFDESTRSLSNFGARMYDSELGRFISPDPTVQKPYDPQTYNRYSYARNNPIRWVDVDGYGFWSWLKSFFAGFVGAIVGIAVTIATQNPILGGMAGGAVAGAINGAFEGGLGGALKGALIGGAIGGITGGLLWGAEQLVQGAGYALAGLAMVGGGAYAGISGGGEGLANYSAGVLGGLCGSALGSSLLTSSLSPDSQTTETNLSPESKETTGEGVRKGDFELIKAGVENEQGKPVGVSGNDKAKVIVSAARSGSLGKGGTATLSEVTGDWNPIPFTGKSFKHAELRMVWRLKASLTADGTLKMYYQTATKITVKLPLLGEKTIYGLKSPWQLFATESNWQGTLPNKLDAMPNSSSLISTVEKMIKP